MDGCCKAVGWECGKALGVVERHSGHFSRRGTRRSIAPFGGANPSPTNLRPKNRRPEWWRPNLGSARASRAGSSALAEPIGRGALLRLPPFRPIVAGPHPPRRRGQQLLPKLLAAQAPTPLHRLEFPRQVFPPPRFGHPQQPLHPGHQVGLRRFQHQMKMMAHQAIGLNLPLGLAAGLGQGGQEHPADLLIAKDRLPAMPPVHHVVNRSGKI